MGFAVAERARLRGAEVTLIAVRYRPPPGVGRVTYAARRHARSSWKAFGRTQDRADVLVMTAAVADYRSRVTESSK
jgi:phosphopantothenoylcysteine decarboxylase/phosphopantothenate--cysteine ligase